MNRRGFIGRAIGALVGLVSAPFAAKALPAPPKINAPDSLYGVDLYWVNNLDQSNIFPECPAAAIKELQPLIARLYWEMVAKGELRPPSGRNDP